MHTAQAHYGTRGPAPNQRLAALVPVAFKAIDKLELRRDLRGELAGVLKGQTMCRQVALDNLHLAVGVHAGGQGEVVGRDHDAAAAARTLSSNEAWPSENEVWVWQSIRGHAGMATPLHMVNPLHCNGVASARRAREVPKSTGKGARCGLACSQNMYISLQKLRIMTCLEADVHVWLGARAATDESHACVTSDVLAFG